MSPIPTSVTVAILTYRRPEQLQLALQSVAEHCVSSETKWNLAEILVIDNDPDGSARQYSEAWPTSTRYIHEKKPGIAHARNRALDEARSDVLVFIDDDEIALPGWPDGLIAMLRSTDATLVGGPVDTEFNEKPPDWVVEGKFFDRDEPESGERQRWLRSGNLALDLAKVRQSGVRFDPRYLEGEDAAFSMQLANKGHDLRWSATARVTERVGPERMTVEWRLNRQKISTNAWVRAELDLDDSALAKGRIAARLTVRLAQGASHFLAGVVRRKPAEVVKGKSLIALARGGAEGLLSYRSHRLATP